MKHFTCILLAALSCATTIAFAQAAAPDKVAQVAKGELKEARASWWGFNAEDSTEFIAKAVSSKVPKLIIDKMPSPWITSKAVKIPSNIEIIFEEDAVLEAKRGCFKSLGEVLVNIGDSKNVILRGLGKGATMKMHKADYHKEPYQKSEWRHCISFYGVENLQILNLTLKDSGGDGIYFGGAGKNPPRNVIVRDVICDGNNRQGISVIAGVNCLVENCKLINTWGTPPAAGIDFEPNKPGEPIRGFVLRNVETYNNQGAGYEFYLANMNATSGPLEVTIENCTSRKDGQSPFSFCSTNGPGFDRPGLVHVKNCIFEDNPANINLQGTCANGYKILFENVTIRNIGTKHAKISPIQAGYLALNEGTSGNFHFINTVVYDTIDREPFQFTNGGQTGGLENVSGTIKSYVNGELKHEFTLTNEWAKQFPKRDIVRMPVIDMKNATFEALTPDAAPQAKNFDNIRLRGTGRWIFLAKAGDTLNLSAMYGQLGGYQGQFANVYITTPSGKKLDIGQIPFKQTATLVKENLPESGLYELTINAGSCWSNVVRCNLPIGIKMYPRTPNFCTGTGYAYFYVPEGTKEFAANFTGQGQEGLKATVWGPDGTKVWEMDDISALEQYVCRGELAQKGGVFKVLLQKPTNLVTIEDYFIQLTNIPSILGLSPDQMIKATAR